MVKVCPYCKTTEDWAFLSPKIVCLNCRYYYLAKKEQREYEKIYDVKPPEPVKTSKLLIYTPRKKMKTSNIVKGMQILQKYYNSDNQYTCSAEHDIIYMFETDIDVSEEDISILEELGWNNEEDCDGAWCCNV
jgi:hypothetical protein